ncbi:glutathione peroxidase [Photobacterium galatheae]|uniref:Glutathione peroxidase n=1 Tax=Photobacterium galatheae TaxID=1654360 RepID=A0A066RPW9_9GAMM|nr:glutathione peroxidase [Photobacterium galatheae]
MKATILVSSLLAFIPVQAAQSDCPPLLNHEIGKLNSTDTVNLCQQYHGQVLLLVNTASQCGFTPQFEGLETLYQTYKDQGFAVIGFPSNDFFQDRGTEKNTAKVCYLDYGVTFPMMSRSAVRGSDVNPIFHQLAEDSGVTPKWNFYKYLVDRQGKVVTVFASTTKPDDTKLTQSIEQLLAQPR